MKRSRLAFALGASLLAASSAHAANYFDYQDIYHGAGAKLYAVGEVGPDIAFRIPAIASMGNGVLITAADVRYAGSIWSDIVAGPKIRKTKLSTKISYDGGLTWSDLSILNAKDGKDGSNDNDYAALATDPALVYNSATNTVLMFGLRNNVNLTSGNVAGHGVDGEGKPNNPDNVQNIPGQQDQKSDFIMFTSKDQGKTWSTKSIYDDIKGQINSKAAGNKYSIVFQGPGGGMVYNNKIYVPIQAWAHAKDTGSGHVSTSGFMVSEDNGETWKVSSMLKKSMADTSIKNTSESNIFYYKGKIRLAVRHETGFPDPNDKNNNGQKLRLCYEYDEKNDSWTLVDEPYIPKDVAIVENSTHNLSEDVYLVGYTSFKYAANSPGGNPNRRQGQRLVTNTGITIALSDVLSEGYTSITHDDSNIYVMYEGDLMHHDIFFKAIDWKHRDYANLNTQIRNRANTVNGIADKFAKETGYISGSFGSDSAGGQIIGSAGALKGGIFVYQNDDLDSENAGVVEYDTFDVALVAGIDQQFAKNIKGTAMLGYMNSNIDYANGSENDVSSLIAGYRLQIDTDYVGIRTGVAAVGSDNSFKRNNKEGLGKSADFDSFSLSFSTELFKDFDLSNYGNVEMTGGMVNTFFTHEDFREVGGEGIGENGQLGANNATIRASNLQSHELFVKAAWNSKPIALSDFANLTFNGDMKYAIDLADADDWNEEYRSMSVERKYDSIGELYSARDGGLFTTSLGADVEILKQIKVGLKGVADSRGEFSAKLEGRISL
ncbi:autotransporter domain-containing protein [Anaerobiospirillum succiniciproducens]|uniref:autotransporter domain-containing protein n=1 Tax=Anaerobiospirillum succiniciproducens TaxID=13335 RepID=UPI003F8C4ADA